VDDDCDPATVDDADVDGDAVSFCAGDCDDSDPAVFPGAAEATCDQVDNDCDAATEDNPDDDGDGVLLCGPDGLPGTGDEDCDDADPATYPGVSEVNCDGTDNDCDGGTFDDPDADADGVGLCTGDCDDNNAAMFEGNPEVCDGLDNNCDGHVGEVYEPVPPNTQNFAIERIRGNKFLMTSDVELGRIGGLLEAPGGATITWVVYGSDTEFGTYTLEASTNTVINGADWFDSGPLVHPLVSGRYYVIGAHWSDAVGFSWRTSAGLPTVTSFGLHLRGALVDNLAAAPPTISPLNSPSAYSFRVFLNNEGDEDADGSRSCNDCDDDDAANYPGNAESCDGQDNDCDGFDDFGNPGVGGAEADADVDGQRICEGDCDDTDDAVYTGATESQCNGIDDDCDPSTVDDEDVDSDGVSLCNGDCDDADPLRSPILLEQTCNGIDDDCDPSSVDDADVDSDGVSFCDGDCADTDPLRFPGNPEVMCNGIDEDCDAATVDDEDVDGDGVSLCTGDCADSDATRFPGNPEVQCNGIDDDCDAATPDDEDADGDGVALCGGDCDDTDSDTFGGPSPAPELCDGIDNNCDGVGDLPIADGDGDGQSPCEGDCEDGDPSIYLGAPELCDEVDNDCDGVVPSDEFDDDGDGFRGCEGDCEDGDPGVHPDVEESGPLCDDSIDNNCDGQLDAYDLDCQGAINPDPTDEPEEEIFEGGCNCAQQPSPSDAPIPALALVLMSLVATGVRRRRA
jgi:MYXO-CTERM domain-containing protein